RNYIEAPAIGVTPTIEPPAVDAPAVGVPTIGAPTIVRYNTLPLGDIPLLGQYQFFAPEKTVKHKREEGTKIEDLTDEQLDHVPLIQLKTLIPKIPKKGLANKTSRKRQAEFPELNEFQSTAENLLQQVAPEEGLDVVKDFIVDDEVEVEREVNLEAISSEYGGDLLEEEVVGEAYQASTDQAIVVSVEEQTKEASADQATVVSVEEQTMEVAKTEDEASQTKESKKEVEQRKEEVIECKDDDDRNLLKKLDPVQVIKDMVVDQTNL
ncbi:hypothetical protein GIB67_000306, partial [Kingdonia uniflora]